MFEKKKKKSKVGSIVFGLDLKRCAECNGPTRPCWIEGNPATFHRWVDEEKALLRIDVFTKPSEQEAIVRRFREEGVHDTASSVEKQRVVLALIEWPDGRVAKVRPEQLRFADREV